MTDNDFDVSEFLGRAIVDGNIVKLPDEQLDRNNYLQVKKKLELIGGKWKGGKVSGFVFQQDPTELLNDVANGDDRNLKKEYQFFATPAGIAKRLVELADIGDSNTILEPSAGQGAIIDAINRDCPTTVDCYELMDLNVTMLSKTNLNFKLIGNDFLTATDAKYDRIIANPPFSKNQDIDHIYKMWELLAEGGRLVTIASKHWSYSTYKKETAFKAFLDDNDAEIINIEPGKFKESGTMVGMCIIVLDKE